VIEPPSKGGAIDGLRYCNVYSSVFDIDRPINRQNKKVAHPVSLAGNG
jgi:hypothetical protein